MKIKNKLTSLALALSMSAIVIAPSFAKGNLPFELSKDKVDAHGELLYEEKAKPSEETVGEWVSGEKKFDTDTKSGSLKMDIKSDKQYQKNDLLVYFDCDGAGAPAEDTKREGLVLSKLLEMQDPDSKVWIGDLHNHSSAGPMTIDQAKEIADDVGKTGEVVGNPRIVPIYQKHNVPYTTSGTLTGFHKPVNDTAVLAILSDGVSYDGSLSSAKSWESDKKLIVPIYVGGGSGSGETINGIFSGHENYQDFSGMSNDDLVTNIDKKLKELKPFKEVYADMHVKVTPDSSDVKISKLTLTDANGKEHNLEVKDGKVDQTITPDTDGNYVLYYEVTGEVKDGAAGISVEITSGDKKLTDRIELKASFEQTKTRVRKQTIHFNTKYMADKSMLFGEMKVVKEGVDGFKQISEEMNSKNDQDDQSSIKETGCNEKAPVDKIVNVGTHVQVFGDIKVTGKANKDVVKKAGEEIEFTFDVTNPSKSLLTAIELDKDNTKNLLSKKGEKVEDKDGKKQGEGTSDDSNKKDEDVKPQKDDSNKKPSDDEKDHDHSSEKEDEHSDVKDHAHHDHDHEVESVFGRFVKAFAMQKDIKEGKDVKEEKNDVNHLKAGEKKTVTYKHVVTENDLNQGFVKMSLAASGIDQEGLIVADMAEVKVKVVKEEKEQPSITQEGDKQTIIVNKNKKDKININNSDKTIVKDGDADCEKTPDCPEKMEKPKLEKPMQKTGVANTLMNADILEFLNVLGLAGMASYSAKKKGKM